MLRVLSSPGQAGDAVPVPSPHFVSTVTALEKKPALGSGGVGGGGEEEGRPVYSSAVSRRAR